MNIKAASLDQLDAVCEGLPERPRTLHSERIVQQNQGNGLYLLAWIDKLPLGHVLVKWPTWPERPWAVEWQARYGCSFIEDLWVHPDNRNRGIGRALMGAAESHCLDYGSSSVGLHVGLDEGYQAARHIYTATAYRDPGHGIFIESAPGEVEPVVFLLKRLPT